MTKSLPARPNLAHLKHEAKDLLKAHQNKSPECCAVLRHLHRFIGRPDAEILAAALTLAEAQFAVAIAYGFRDWAALKAKVGQTETAADVASWLKTAGVSLKQPVSRLEVAQYFLQAKFARLRQAPFDPAANTDLKALIETIGLSSPRHSPAHLYAAITDERVHWFKTVVPVDRVVMGPGDGSNHLAAVVRAQAFIKDFVAQVLAAPPHSGFDDYRQADALASRYSMFIVTLEDYRASTPFVPEPKPDLGLIFKLKGGYHRAFRVIATGATTLPVYLGLCDGNAPWAGNHAHLEHWDVDHWHAKNQEGPEQSVRGGNRRRGRLVGTGRQGPAHDLSLQDRAWHGGDHGDPRRC